MVRKGNGLVNTWMEVRKSCDLLLWNWVFMFLEVLRFLYICYLFCRFLGPFWMWKWNSRRRSLRRLWLRRTTLWLLYIYLYWRLELYFWSTELFHFWSDAVHIPVHIFECKLSVFLHASLVRGMLADFFDSLCAFVSVILLEATDEL